MFGMLDYRAHKLYWILTPFSYHQLGCSVRCHCDRYHSRPLHAVCVVGKDYDRISSLWAGADHRRAPDMGGLWLFNRAFF